MIFTSQLLFMICSFLPFSFLSVFFFFSYFLYMNWSWFCVLYRWNLIKISRAYEKSLKVVLFSRVYLQNSAAFPSLGLNLESFKKKNILFTWKTEVNTRSLFKHNTVYSYLNLISIQSLTFSRLFCSLFLSFFDIQNVVLSQNIIPIYCSWSLMYFISLIPTLLAKWHVLFFWNFIKNSSYVICFENCFIYIPLYNYLSFCCWPVVFNYLSQFGKKIGCVYHVCTL